MTFRLGGFLLDFLFAHKKCCAKQWIAILHIFEDHRKEDIYF
ncbi:hypothetical protein RchiOBHm_Chr3g0482211 [Rosa chinensis]|uniref:Uncharacterized protein n=1 Tax=Rosa chinensis TaxID=74649 RepID=A0A2P6RE54_ROSCH|nr:hypothetical protein RchiOBHm_Chr3g0482211 [Rosa chinensis]